MYGAHASLLYSSGIVLRGPCGSRVTRPIDGQSHDRYPSPPRAADEVSIGVDVTGMGQSATNIGCVSSVILLSRYMRPEGPWQRLAAALADSSDHFSAFNHTPSQIEMIGHSRAP